MTTKDYSMERGEKSNFPIEEPGKHYLNQESRSVINSVTFVLVVYTFVVMWWNGILLVLFSKTHELSLNGKTTSAKF